MTNIRNIEIGWRALVQPWEQAVVVRSGVIERVVGPGRHRRRRRELWRVVDPRAWLTEADIPADALYVLAQLAVREAIAERPLDEVLSSRADVLAGVRDAFTATVAALGAEVLEFSVRDVTLSAELRHAFAETALAREQGRAKLERARADAAALRSLANVAQVLEAHPSLLQLRTLEAAAGAGGRGQFIVRIGDAGPVVVE